MELSHVTFAESVHVDLYKFDRSLTRVKCQHSTVPRVFDWLKRCTALEQLELTAVKHVTATNDTCPKLSWPRMTSLIAQKLSIGVRALIADTPLLRHLVLRDCKLLDDTHLDAMTAQAWIGRVSHLVLSPTLFTESAVSTLLTKARRLLQFECTRAVFSDEFWALVARRTHLRITFIDHPC